jgi:ACR3 family arsenite efflux pump ArsB
MFKLTRHFQASKVLTETASKVWRQILGMLALLAFFVVLLAIFLFQVDCIINMCCKLCLMYVLYCVLG